ncbi:MAG TPA: acyltransferase family protein [Phenylobacterium sp.]|nr:acyltransferase family protein [Phenylobacterium sp.]
MTAQSERLHGLDAVRGYALLLGVVFHATMSFLPGPQVWPVADSHRTPVLAAVFFASHTFRMTTFFLIAGFFAHMTFHKRGLKGFVIDRLKRIALPLVVFWPILIAGILLSAGYAVYVATGVFPTKPPPSPPQPPGHFPLTHLWFLYTLLWLYAATLAVRSLVARLDRSGAFRARVDRLTARAVASPLSPAILAIPVVTAFCLSPHWLVWFGVAGPDSNLIPNLPAATQYVTAFGFGWLLHRQPALLETWTRRWPLNLAAAATLATGLMAALGLQPVTHPDPSASVRLAHACAYGLAMWTGTFAAIGLALRFLSNHSRVRRYIADSSYWIYLVHLPIVMFLQAWVSRFDWPWEAKFATILGIGFALMFATYELLVRHSFVGAMLNGRRAPWRSPQTPQSIAQASIAQPEVAQ